jgi:hypothetical protein
MGKGPLHVLVLIVFAPNTHCSVVPLLRPSTGTYREISMPAKVIFPCRLPWGGAAPVSVALLQELRMMPLMPLAHHQVSP